MLLCDAASVVVEKLLVMGKEYDTRCNVLLRDPWVLQAPGSDAKASK